MESKNILKEFNVVLALAKLNGDDFYILR